MNIKWYKGLSSSDRKGKIERKEIVESSGLVLQLLTSILNSDIDTLQRERDSKDNFVLPAYSETQAWYSGRIATLRRVVKLINIKES